MAIQILCIAGPTASGKSARAVEEALARGGEIISVDSRQVYRGLDIGTEKISRVEMRGIPHYLIDVRAVNEPYSAGDFVADGARLITEISGRGKLPILVGGTHFYFDALLRGIPMGIALDPVLRAELSLLPDTELFARVRFADPRRAAELDPRNRRRLIRALELISALGTVPERSEMPASLQAEWIVIDPPAAELRSRIDARLKNAFARGLIDEVRAIGRDFGDTRLDELGLEYRIVGEYLRGERAEASLIPALSAKLWQYARRQKAWLRKLKLSLIPAAA